MVLALGAHPAGAAAASFSINDASLNEGNSATTTFGFTVTLSDPPPPPGNFTFMVSFQTTAGTATAGSTCGGTTDYVTTSGQLTFNRNNLTRPVNVSVCGDTAVEPDESFFVDLSNATGGATITKSRGTGTIRNDDVALTRPTSTTVSCGTSTVGISSNCTATVSDTGSGIKTTPTGTVSWSSSPAGTFASTQCMLSPTATVGVATCSVGFTPSSAGANVVTGSYGGSLIHNPSQGQTTVQVAKRTTNTSVTCTPSSVSVGDSTSCTATVTDTSGGTTSTPTGTVNFSSEGSGSFTPASCMLDASGKCSVSYSPSAVGSGSHTITATYEGDAKHAGSSGSTAVTVTKRTTNTSVTCSPSSFRAGGNTSCTATVTDTSGGTTSTPTGTVNFATDGAGSFTTASCTLDAGKCSVTYSSTKAANDKITATYDGDATHEGSSGFTTVTVRPGPPNAVTVSPPEATNTAGEEHCVTATVKDAFGNTAEAGVSVYFSVTGANTASATEMTDASGQAAFCYTGTKAGADTIKAVADRDDPPNGPDDGDPFGTANKTYKPGPAANVAVAPATATNPVRTQHCVTATVTDRFDNPVEAGTDVYFSVTGANPTSSAVKVDADGSGKAQFCYTGRNGGTDTIKAVADKDNPPNGADASDPFGTASKTWLSNIPCKVQGTGTISSTQQFNFGVDYSAGAAAPVGSATYIDSGQGKQFSSTRIAGLVCFGVTGGAHAIFFGSGLVNGIPVSDFQIDIDDLGSGPGTDKFAIQWPGYSAAGTLVTGDIQITLK
ncbi:MAG: Ig-like domain repeat protein [Thermoleophilaceae bacterium]